MTTVTLDLSTMTMADLELFVENARDEVRKNSSAVAMSRINELVKQAHDLIAQAEKIADENKVTFDFSVEYGVGGTYYPKGGLGDHGEEWESSYEGWVSSSSQC